MKTNPTPTPTEIEHFPCDCRCHEPEYAYQYPVIPCDVCSKKDTNPPTETDKTKQCFCQSIYNGETNTVDNCTCGKCVDAIANHTETVKNCKKCYEEKNYGICPHNHSTETVSECRCVCHTDKPWLSPHSSERCLCQKLTPIGPTVEKWEEEAERFTRAIKTLMKDRKTAYHFMTGWFADLHNATLSLSVQEAKAERDREIMEEINSEHERLMEVTRGTFPDRYSNDYLHGILRGYTLLGRFLASLKQEEVI